MPVGLARAEREPTIATTIMSSSVIRGCKSAAVARENHSETNGAAGRLH